MKPCGAPTPSDPRRATLFCEREEGHAPASPHIVSDGAGRVLRKWDAHECAHDECYWADDDNVPGDHGVCCKCGAIRPNSR